MKLVFPLLKTKNPSSDRKVDRNTDNHQRITKNVDEREAAWEATGRTTENSHKHCSPYLSIGTPSLTMISQAASRAA